MNSAQAESIARMILGRIRDEYPHHHGHVVESPADLETPRATHPAFYGCFDWHSAVHSHWALLRILHTVSEVACADEIRSVLDEHLTESNLATELEVFTRPINSHYERPYGWAWLLTLHGECQGTSWETAVRPLARHFEDRLVTFLDTVDLPDRAGTHRNTAYALGLILDYARLTGRVHLAAVAARRAVGMFGSDRDWPFGYEPSGTDFLSPGLAEADLMRRVLAPEQLHRWLIGFFPEGRPPRLTPVVVGDRKDPLEGHLIGLAFHRAIALEAIASALPDDHEFTEALVQSAEEHREIGLSQTDGTGWGGEHWLGSFAVYLLTGNN